MIALVSSSDYSRNSESLCTTGVIEGIPGPQVANDNYRTYRLPSTAMVGLSLSLAALDTHGERRLQSRAIRVLEFPGNSHRLRD